MPVSYASQIRPLFRDSDVSSMQTFGLDLSSYEEVKVQASQILERLLDGSMPCDGAWPAERVALFKLWMDEGMLP